jgi:hypothetical protein
LLLLSFFCVRLRFTPFGQNVMCISKAPTRRTYQRRQKRRNETTEKKYKRRREDASFFFLSLYVYVRFLSLLSAARKRRDERVWKWRFVLFFVVVETKNFCFFSPLSQGDFETKKGKKFMSTRNTSHRVLRESSK